MVVISDPEKIKPRRPRPICRWEATAFAFASHVCILTTFNIPHHMIASWWGVALPVPDATFAVTNTLRRAPHVGTSVACFPRETSSVSTTTFTIAPRSPIARA